MVDITRYVHCKRCDHWLPEFEIGEHLNYHASIIFDNLLLGNRICSMSRTELVGRMKVTHIVNAAAELSNAFEN